MLETFVLGQVNLKVGRIDRLSFNMGPIVIQSNYFLMASLVDEMSAFDCETAI